MNKLSLTLVIIILTTLTSFAQLRVSESKRYLETTEGKPFLWIGDTAWELFHRLNREEAVEYLENRKAKGINVIQAVVLAERDGLRIPNPYGTVPFKDLDPAQPNDAYFEHVDFIVNEAEKLGLYLGMLPTWGDKIFSNNPGAGPIVFNKNNAFVYGEFLGNRYKNKPIIWILGGDRNIANDEVLEIWRAMAAGIKKGDEGKHLITYHPRGNSSSSKSLHNEEWLDFNMYQSGHDEKFNDVYRLAQNDYNLKPLKPTIDGEPAYEDIAVKFWEYIDFSKNEKERVPNGVLDDDGLIIDKSHFADGFFDDYDVRVHAYWNFLAGACGYTYGNNAIWQMYKKGEGSAIPCLYDWRESMDRPGAFDLQNIRTLLEDKFYKIIPDQSIIADVSGEGENRIAAATSTDGSFALVYLAKGQAVQINLNQLGEKIKATWFNPRNGEYQKIGKYKNKKNTTFSPPGSGIGNDWMLVLESN